MTCTAFYSISVVCYSVLCSRGVGCLDHSLLFCLLSTTIDWKAFQTSALAKTAA